MNSRSTRQLAQSPLWTQHTECMSFDERVRLSYKRAESLIKHFNLTADDVLHLSEKYYQFHSDPILSMDVSVTTLLTIHLNLCIGTLAMYRDNRPDIEAVIEKLLTFELNGQYCLTELGHGLDVINMETTCTLLSTGELELHTPVSQAAKYMPPTSPSGYPCVSIVHARLIVEGEDRGPKVFLVYLHNGHIMSPGVISRSMFPRGGSKPVKHCLTYFNHVRLPYAALLGDARRPNDLKSAFFHNISRVITGTLSMGLVGLTCLRSASYIAAQYSLRRTVLDAASKSPRSIASFSTQYVAVVSAVVQTFILESMARRCHAMFVAETDTTQKHFIAAVFKTTMLSSAQKAILTLSTRCGAQGLQEVNQISGLYADLSGAAIAEGDLLGISIKFVIDILLGRVRTSEPTVPTVLYAREQSMIKTLRTQMAGQRDETTMGKLLPHCQSLIEAIGQRLALESAIGDGIDSDILAMYVSTVEHTGIGWSSPDSFQLNGTPYIFHVATVEVEAAAKLLPRLPELLHQLDVAEYMYAPIVSDDKWEEYVSMLPVYGGSESLEIRRRDVWNDTRSYL